MKSIAQREAELHLFNSPQLLKLLLSLNPFGGYSIGAKRGQMTRATAIETILRYEGYYRVKQGNLAFEIAKGLNTGK